MKHIVVVGLGLIGGSLVRCLRTIPEVRIIGCGTPQDQEQPWSYWDGCLDALEPLEQAIRKADGVFLCTPIQTCIELLPVVAAGVRDRTVIVSDVCSTKQQICVAAEQLDWGRSSFIGGHPMAGKERSGFLHGSRQLFHEAHYVLTPTESTRPEALTELTEVLRSATGATIVCMDPREHDRVVAAVSHVPHVLASVLVAQVAEWAQQDERYTALAAGGFRDLTRIASGDADLWRQIVLSNAEAVQETLQPLIQRLQRLQIAVQTQCAEDLQAELQRAVAYRSTIPIKGQTYSPVMYECTVVDVVFTECIAHLPNTYCTVHVDVVRRSVRLGYDTATLRTEAMQTLQALGYTVHV